MRFQYTTCFDLNDKKTHPQNFQGVFRRWNGRRFLFFRFETSKQKKGLEKKVLKLGNLKIHGIFRFLPEMDREISLLFPGSPKNSGVKTKQWCCFCIAKAAGLCATKNRESMVIEQRLDNLRPIWEGEGYDWGVSRWFPWGDLVTSTLHSRLLGSMVLGSYQDHPLQLFSYVAELQIELRRIDEPNAQNKTSQQTNQPNSQQTCGYQ